MLIMLASLSGFSGGIPVTMLLVAALYLGQQVYDVLFVHDNVANFMHIVGGICGTGFGYVYALRPQKRKPAAHKASGKPGLKFEKDLPAEKPINEKKRGCCTTPSVIAYAMPPPSMREAFTANRYAKAPS